MRILKRLYTRKITIYILSLWIGVECVIYYEYSDLNSLCIGVECVNYYEYSDVNSLCIDVECVNNYE